MDGRRRVGEVIKQIKRTKKKTMLKKNIFLWGLGWWWRKPR